jgi:Taurine catabolism dioxygenase TauD, TfdA family
LRSKSKLRIFVEQKIKAPLKEADMSDQGYLPYKEQTVHYFNRPHEAIPDQSVDIPAAWYGKDLRQNEDWIETLNADDVAEIEAAIDAALASGKETRDLQSNDFPLPALSLKIANWRDAIKHDRGFQVIRGIPVENWSQEKAELFFWCFGLHLGRPGAQNQNGDLLGHVKDMGNDGGDALSRLYKTAANIDYHCDGADIVGLLCLKKAKSGGKSRIVSSVTVFNELIRQRPDLAERLFQPLKLDIRNENSKAGRKFIEVTPCRYGEGVLRTFYHADYFRSVVRHDEVAPFTDQEQQLLDLYESIAAQEDLLMDMDLQPGDIQLLSNHTNLHARTDYEDHEDPKEKRHLLRLWLSLMD